MNNHTLKKNFILKLLFVILPLIALILFSIIENVWFYRVKNALNAYVELIYAAWYQHKQPVQFSVKSLRGVNIERPTSLQFGPDGKLYVSTQDGLIYQYKINKDNTGNYQATDSVIIDLIKSIPNHDDDGNLNPAINKRQVTGLLVKGTPENPKIFVTSSDPRIGGLENNTGSGNDGDVNLDTNSGILSALTWNGISWGKTDLVRGFPRSEENHSLNGLAIDESGKFLYISCGGNTNAGSPSKFFGMLTEYALSACILEVNLGMIDTMPLRDSGNAQFKYNLPTLDDPARINVADGFDVNDPFGGHDGLNQAKMITNSPVKVFSPGYRNAYDIVVTSTPGRKNRIYTIDNGANMDMGGYPDKEGSPKVTNNYVQGEPGSGTKGINDLKVNDMDNLHLVFKPGMDRPIYGGHPNPIRANPASAGLLWVDDTIHFSLQPTRDWPAVPVSMANPIENDFRNPGVNDKALTVFYNSTNGFAEYKACRYFNDALTGDLIAADFNGSILRIKLNPEGTKVIFKETLAKNFATIPLDLTTQGDFEIFPGTIWIADYGGNNIYILEPKEDDLWTTLKSSDGSEPGARHESGFVEAGGNFYLIGGRGKLPVNKFDPLSGKWSTVSPIPGNKELNHFQAVSHQKKIYLIAAFTGEFPSEKSTGDIYIYDTETKTWTIKKDIIPPSRQRGSAATVVYQNKIYICGGIINGHINGSVNWTDVYDPLTDSWTPLADAPHKRDHFQLAVLNEKLYAIGGRRTNLENDKLFSDTESSVDYYDIKTNTWITLPGTANLPTPRAGSSTVVIQDKIFVIGGESNKPGIHKEVEAFDPVTISWHKFPELVSGRHGTQAVAHGNCIYIVCGSGKQGGGPELNSLEMYCPANISRIFENAGQVK